MKLTFGFGSFLSLLISVTAYAIVAPSNLGHPDSNYSGVTETSAGQPFVNFSSFAKNVAPNSILIISNLTEQNFTLIRNDGSSTESSFTIFNLTREQIPLDAGKVNVTFNDKFAEHFNRTGETSFGKTGKSLAIDSFVDKVKQVSHTKPNLDVVEEDDYLSASVINSTLERIEVFDQTAGITNYTEEMFTLGEQSTMLPFSTNLTSQVSETDLIEDNYTSIRYEESVGKSFSINLSMDEVANHTEKNFTFGRNSTMVEPFSTNLTSQVSGTVDRLEDNYTSIRYQESVERSFPINWTMDEVDNQTKQIFTVGENRTMIRSLSTNFTSEVSETVDHPEDNYTSISYEESVGRSFPINWTMAEFDNQTEKKFTSGENSTMVRALSTNLTSPVSETVDRLEENHTSVRYESVGRSFPVNWTMDEVYNQTEQNVALGENSTTVRPLSTNLTGQVSETVDRLEDNYTSVRYEESVQRSLPINWTMDEVDNQTESNFSFGENGTMVRSLSTNLTSHVSETVDRLDNYTSVRYEESVQRFLPINWTMDEVDNQTESNFSFGENGTMVRSLSTNLTSHVSETVDRLEDNYTSVRYESVGRSFPINWTMDEVYNQTEQNFTLGENRTMVRPLSTNLTSLGLETIYRIEDNYTSVRYESVGRSFPINWTIDEVYNQSEQNFPFGENRTVARSLLTMPVSETDRVEDNYTFIGDEEIWRSVPADFTAEQIDKVSNHINHNSTNVWGGSAASFFNFLIFIENDTNLTVETFDVANYTEQINFTKRGDGSSSKSFSNFLTFIDNDRNSTRFSYLTEKVEISNHTGEESPLSTENMRTRRDLVFSRPNTLLNLEVSEMVKTNLTDGVVFNITDSLDNGRATISLPMLVEMAAIPKFLNETSIFYENSELEYLIP